MPYNLNYNDQMNSNYGHPSSRQASNLHAQVNDIYGTTTGTTGRIIGDPVLLNANPQVMNNTHMHAQSAIDPNLHYSGAMADQKNIDQSSTVIGSTGAHDQIHNESLGSTGNYTRAHRGSTGSTESYNQGHRGSVGSHRPKRTSVGSAYAAAGAFGAIGAPHRYTDQDNTISDLPSGRRDHIGGSGNAQFATEADRVQYMSSATHGNNQNVEVTHNGANNTMGAYRTGRRPSISDKIKGNLEKLAGKITRDQDKVIHGDNVAKGQDF